MFSIKIVYSIGCINLDSEIKEIFNKIHARTEIRKAQKRGIKIEIIPKKPLFPLIKKRCKELLSELFKRELIPWSNKFDKILNDDNNLVFFAKKGSLIISFLIIDPDPKSLIKNQKTAYLSLAATDEKFKNDCPNYLLIWEAIKYLKENGYKFFNLGLLNYKNCFDPDLEKVAFFKRKWNIFELQRIEKVSLFKYLWLKYLKRFRFFKKIKYCLEFLKIKFLNDERILG